MKEKDPNVNAFNSGQISWSPTRKMLQDKKKIKYIYFDSFELVGFGRYLENVTSKLTDFLRKKGMFTAF